MCSLSAATRWRYSDNRCYGKDRKLSFLVTIYSLLLLTAYWDILTMDIGASLIDPPIIDTVECKTKQFGVSLQ